MPEIRNEAKHHRRYKEVEMLEIKTFFIIGFKRLVGYIFLL